MAQPIAAITPPQMGNSRYLVEIQRFIDAAGNTTTGRQLTFFTADDTILVQSENTSLPPQRHRVEK